MQKAISLKDFKKKKEASQYLKDVAKLLSECDHSVFSHEDKEK